MNAQDEDAFVDGPTFDDDLALSADDLATGLANGNTEGISAAFDEKGDYAIHGSPDEEWTDADAEGETDDEPEDCEDEVMISSQDINTTEQLETMSDNISDDDDEFYDPSISLVHGAILPISEGHYYFDEAGGR